MAKLFSMEDDEIVMPEGAQGEGQQEVAEVAAVETELAEDDMGETEEIGQAVDAGIEASGELEQVEKLVEKADEEEGGLTPVAAEAVRIALEAIASKVDYPVEKRVYTVYSAESFSATSSRRANTQLALEGIRDFLADLWERIKAAVRKMWDKIVAFWDKHVSTVGRLVKATKSMDKKIQDASTKTPKEDFKDEKPCPAPLANLFQFGSTLKPELVKEALGSGTTGYIASVDSSNILKLQAAYIDDANKLLSEVEKAIQNSENTNKGILGNIKFEKLEASAGLLKTGLIGTEGKQIKINIANQTSTDNTVDTAVGVALEITRNDKAEKPEDVVPGNVAELKAINARATNIAQEAFKMIDIIRKAKDNIDKLQKNMENMIRKIEKKAEVKKSDLKGSDVSSKVTQAETAAMIRKTLSAYASASRTIVQIFNLTQSEYIKLVKGALMYCSFSLRQYR